MRTYRVDRIKELTDTGLSFTRPDDFDLPALWAAWAEEFESSRYRLHTRVRLTDRGLHLLPSLSSQRTAAGAATARRCADGRHEVDLVVESVPVAVHEFSAYGADLEVIDPRNSAPPWPSTCARPPPATPPRRRRPERPTPRKKPFDPPVTGGSTVVPMDAQHGPDGLYTIGELAQRTGLSVKTIRFYADEGIVPPTARTTAGYRLYDAEAAARLDLVRTLRELGLGLPAIRGVLDGGGDLGQVAAAHAEALDARIRILRLRRAVLRTIARKEPTARRSP
ncbi:MerR family transcriptional regulator [Nocardiopsis composta]